MIGRNSTAATRFPDAPREDPVTHSSPFHPDGRWVGIVANSSSGAGGCRRRVARLVSLLQVAGFQSRVAWTPHERIELVRRSVIEPGCQCLVAAGGDGTVSSLLNESPQVPVTVLPAGTENLFARHFGIKTRARLVAETIAQGETRSMDLGVADGRRFALMAGIGFDAEVVTRHHQRRLGRSGSPRPTSRAAYVEPVLRASLRYPFPLLTVRVDGPSGLEELSGTTAFVFNLPDYALGLPIAPSARADDGLLDLVLFRARGPFHALHYLWLVFRGLHLKRRGVEHRRVTRVSVEVPVSVPVQLDGDPGGIIDPGQNPPWTCEVLPGAVRVMVPASYSLVARS